MNPDALFLRRCSQIEMLRQSRDDLDLVDLAGRLRQMLWDAQALANTVNLNRIKLQFEVGALPLIPPDQPQPIIHVLGLGIDPLERTPGQQVVTLAQNQLGQHLIGRINGEDVSVLHVIKFAANKVGGVHFNADAGEEYREIAALSRGWRVNDGSIVLYHIRPIAGVIMRGLAPLIENVRSRYL